MAEIRIEEKKNNWMYWLLGVIGLLLIGWLAVDFFDSDGEPELLTADEVNFPDAHLTDRTDNDVVNARVQGTHSHNMDDKFAHDTDGDFDRDWDGEQEDFRSNVVYYLGSIDRISEDMNVHHDYSNVALRALSNSIMALATETNMKDETNVAAKCKMIKENAKEITEDWQDTNHADLIREAAIASTNVLKEIQEEKFPNLQGEVLEVEKFAKNIKKGTLTLDQKKSVKAFFRSAANLLQKMNPQA